MPRRETDRTAWCELGPRERDAFDRMKSEVGIASDGDLIRVALYRFAAHLGLNPDTELFHVRGGKRRSRNAPRNGQAA